MRMDHCLDEHGYDAAFAARVEATLVRVLADTTIRVSMRQSVPIDAATSV